MRENTLRLAVRGMVAASLAAGCGGSGGGRDDVYCNLDDGRRIPAGAAFSDGCNCCVCTSAGQAACQGAACPGDGGYSPPGSCQSDQDCEAQEHAFCVFDPGCDAPRGTCLKGVGVCPTFAVSDLAPFQYCGCDGVTYDIVATPTFPREYPYRPYRHYGACLAVEAGATTDAPQAPATDAGSDGNGDRPLSTTDGAPCVPLASVRDQCPPDWAAAVADQSAFCAADEAAFFATFLSSESCRGSLHYTRYLFDAGPRYCLYDPATGELLGYRAVDGKAGLEQTSCGGNQGDFDDQGCAGTTCSRPDASAVDTPEGPQVSATDGG